MNILREFFLFLLAEKKSATGEPMADYIRN